MAGLEEKNRVELDEVAMMMKFFCFFVIPLLAQASKKDDPECVRGPSSWYQGSMNVTRNGLSCQRWDVDTPHRPNFVPTDGGHHSYCRNPDNDIQGLWCYTTDPEVKWDYCEVPKCHDESLLVWSDFHHQFAHILATHADPELINPSTTSSGHFNLSILVKSENTNFPGNASEFTAVTGSFRKQIIYYVDQRRNYVGKLDIVTSQRSEHLHGMAAKIKDITLDWITGNVYWSDGIGNAVMVGDGDLKYHSVVYNTDPYAPCGVAVHPPKRLLFFSIYKPMASTVVRTDMSGQNATTILKFPQIFDVTSITVDYHDNRIYLGDFWNFGSMVLSTDLDGTNRVQHFYRHHSRFSGIASHLEYVYVADGVPAFDDKGEVSYSLYLISKKFRKTLKYAVDGEPRGVAVLPEFVESETGPRIGSCSSSPPCDHICLPRINETRICECSTGFAKTGDTGCVKVEDASDDIFCPSNIQCVGEDCPTNNIYNRICACSHGFTKFGAADCNEGPYLYAVDGGSQSVYRVNMTSQSNFTRVISAEREILSLATNPMRQGEVVWSAGDSIYKTQDGITTVIATNVTASALDVDTISGNVFFYDDTVKIIYVTDSNTIVPFQHLDESADVTTITFDVVNRLLYWCDTRGSVGEGQLWMSYLGGDKTIILDYLMFPQAVAVGHKRQSIFIVDGETQQLIEYPMTATNYDVASVEYDLSVDSLRKSADRTNFSDMTVDGDDVYFVRSGEDVITKYSLLDGSVELIGEGQFSDVTHIAIHRSFGLVEMIQCNDCDGICIPYSFYGSMCLEH